MYLLKTIKIIKTIRITLKTNTILNQTKVICLNILKCNKLLIIPLTDLHNFYNKINKMLICKITNYYRNNRKYQYPIQIRCPCCKLHVTSVVNQEPGNTTYAWLGTCLICFGIPFCLIPYFVDGCLDKNHYCPSCGFNILRKHQSCC